jgi:hypothetical protein
MDGAGSWQPPSSSSAATAKPRLPNRRWIAETPDMR